MQAARKGEVAMLDKLLLAGADATATDECGNSVMEKAATLAVMRRLQTAGADAADISDHLRQALTGLDPSGLDSTAGEFHAGRNRRFGSENPARINTPFWRAMVAARAPAWAARRLSTPDLAPALPVWCYSRFGQSITELGDGQVVEIGGEHEDFYDPDFCIYNDVVVYDGEGGFVIYGYPRDVFPPTDFHSATLFKGWIYLIGSLGYSEEREYGRAQVLRLSTVDFHIERPPTSGDDPGWISGHRARLQPPSAVYISGGRICTEQSYDENQQDYLFDLKSFPTK